MDRPALFDERRLSEILQRHQPELLALDPSILVFPRASRARVVAVTNTLIENFRPIVLEDELSKVRAVQRRAQLGGLEERALAYYAADLARAESASDEQTRRAQLSERVADHDRYLFKWAQPLYGDDPELAAVLADIKRGRGLQDDAEDVLRLVGLYRTHWDRAAGQVPVTPQRLDQAEADATEMVTLLDASPLDKKRDLAWRAYTMWRKDYHDLMNLGRYLLCDTKGVESMFPSIGVGRTTGSRQPSSSAGNGRDNTDDAAPAGDAAGNPGDPRADAASAAVDPA
ncbi:MAG: hypothetical protein MJE77_43065 [Proteobacteria bacterium]|nr:hypothetical protein [Pseudomonadota bacterium]